MGIDNLIDQVLTAERPTHTDLDDVALGRLGNTLSFRHPHHRVLALRNSMPRNRVPAPMHPVAIHDSQALVSSAMSKGTTATAPVRKVRRADGIAAKKKMKALIADESKREVLGIGGKTRVMKIRKDSVGERKSVKP